MGYDVYATSDEPYSVRAGNSSEELELALSHIRKAMYMGKTKNWGNFVASKMAVR